MFRLERNAIQRPLKINFDDYVIKRFNIPKGTTSVMMSDLIAGPLPGYVRHILQKIENRLKIISNMIKKNYFGEFKQWLRIPALIITVRLDLIEIE